MKPLVFLDVDGVLNAFPGSPDPGWGWGPSTTVRVNGYSICYSPVMVAALNDLAEHVDFHWLTTWRTEAPTMLAPAIGLNGGDWPVLNADDRPATWWKLTAIRERLQTHRGQAFWIDDDIVFDRDAVAWLEDTPDVIPICPTTSRGLTRPHVNNVAVAITGVVPT